MLTVHHLNDSRSQRILWLLEELGLPYDIRFYQRDAVTRLAPPELKAVHPLGKSPVVTEGEHVWFESGAIIDNILRHHGNGRMMPALGSADYDRYVEWLHYAEGSAMTPFLLRLYTSRLGDAAAPLQPRIDSETVNHIGFINQALEGREWLVGDALSGADIQLSFVGEIAAMMGMGAKFPALGAWVSRFKARPAYQTALKRGGPYSYA